MSEPTVELRELPGSTPASGNSEKELIVTRRHRQLSLFGLAMIAVTALLVVPPLVRVVLGSFQGVNPDGSPGALTSLNYINLLADPDLFVGTVNSLIFATGSAVLALVLGASQAWIVERTDASFKGLAFIGAVVSLATPFVLYVVAFMLLFGRAGPINDLLKLALGTSNPPLNIASMWGMILIEAVLWIPLVYLMLAPIFRAGNPALEEAALISGASLVKTIWRVTFRLAAPGTLAVLLLVFVRSIEAFEVPAVVGMPGGLNVLTTNVYLNLKMQMPPDLGRASAFAVFLIVLVSSLLAIYQNVLKRSERYAVVTGSSYRPRVLKLGRARWLAQALLILNFLLCVVMPIGMLAWVSLLPFYQGVSQRALAQLTLAAYSSVFHGDDITAMFNTVLLSAGTATVTMTIAALAGWLIARRAPGSRLLDQLGTVPLIFPGIVLAVAMIQIFVSFPVPIYGTLWILLLAFTIRYIPYGFRYSTAGIVQIHPELEQASRVSGANVSTMLRRIVFPLVSPALGFGWLFIFLLTARDLSMPVLLSGSESKVVALTLYERWVDGQQPELAALGLVWTALMTILAAVVYFFGGSRGLGGTRE
jgi:iron(III) transport system permease protein